MTANDSKPNQQPQTGGIVSKSLLNILLIFIESAISLTLRADPELRQIAYPLAKANTVVRIRSYLPHTEVYATFSHHGVLFDTELAPDKAHADITINAYSFHLGKLLISHNADILNQLQIRGDGVMVEALTQFLVRVGIGGPIQHLLAKVSTNPKQKPTAEQKSEKIAEYKRKISEQAARIDELATQNKRLDTQLAELQGKQKSTFIGFILTAVIAVISVISHFVI
ncbi:hypothetical protein [Moraxella marmotae]|uniref:hypothetical protein n=1 Tax=Moraxella marmotae TaxID=3344520 RepID=UPI0035F400BD